MKSVSPLLLSVISLTSATAVAQVCSNWEVIPSPDPASAELAILRDIVAIAHDNVWAVGDYFDGNEIRPLSMHWDGNRWTIVPVPFEQHSTSALWAIDAFDADNIWAAGDRQFAPPGGSFGSHVFVVRWTGTEWERMDTPILGLGSGDFLYGMLALSPNDVWFFGLDHPQAQGPQPALAMHWDGANFELTTVPIVNPELGRNAGNELRDASALAPDDIWAVGTTDVTAQGAHDYSQIMHWDGQQWTHVPGPTPGYFNQLFAVEAVAPDDVWVAGEYWHVNGISPFMIRWNGSIWTEVPAPGGILDMFAFAPDDIYAVGSGVFHYDGTSWTTISTFPQVDAPALAGVDASGPCQLWSAGRDLIGSQLSTLTVRSVPSTHLPGDLNCDGFVDNEDIDAFVLAVTQGQAAYQAAWPNCNFFNGDINGDGFVDNEDIDPFVALITGP